MSSPSVKHTSAAPGLWVMGEQHAGGGGGSYPDIDNYDNLHPEDSHFTYDAYGFDFSLRAGSLITERRKAKLATAKKRRATRII